MNFLIYIYLIINAICFFIYGIDKFFAIKKKQRISENFLITFAFLAPIGAMFSMIVFNHKTSKVKFRFFIPIFNLIQFGLIYYIFSNNLLSFIVIN